MLDPKALKPITGTFVSPLLGDTGINNWGLAEWEADFRLMRSLGFDTIVVIRCETEQGGHHWSALDPRGTTWPEDPDLLSMFFRLGDKYDMKLYLGGTISITNLHRGDWQAEVRENRVFYERMLERFDGRPCFYGLYLTIEALPWHFNFFDIAEGVVTAMRELAPEKKTLFSPTFYGLKGDMGSHYTPAEFKEIFGRLFDRVAGKLDCCAWQDKYNIPDCRYGEIEHNPLEDWYAAAKEILDRNGIELWANIESFQRPPGGGKPGTGHGDFRQADYRTLIGKIAAASPYVEKLITFEFSTCMSPQAEWGSAGRLLERYVEALGMDKSTIARPE